MEFNFHQSDYRHFGLDLYQVIEAKGEITEQTPSQLLQFAGDIGLIPGGSIYLDSPGGDLHGGMELGRVIRCLELDTYVLNEVNNGGMCASACSLAFLGGLSRHISTEGVYKLHRFFHSDEGEAHSDDLETAQIVSAQIIEYFKEMGVDPSLFSLMSRAGRTETFEPDLETLRSLKVVNSGVRHKRWEIVTKSGMLYLKGEVDDGRGIQKMTFHKTLDGGVCLVGFIAVPDPMSLEGLVDSQGIFIESEMIELDAHLSYTFEHVMFIARLSNEHLESLCNAGKIGVFTQPPNKQLFSGFKIEQSDAERQQLSSYFDWCKSPLLSWSEMMPNQTAKPK